MTKTFGRFRSLLEATMARKRMPFPATVSTATRERMMTTTMRPADSLPTSTWVTFMQDVGVVFMSPFVIQLFMKLSDDIAGSPDVLWYSDQHKWFRWYSSFTWRSLIVWSKLMIHSWYSRFTWRSLIVWPKQLMIHRWYSRFTWRSLIVWSKQMIHIWYSRFTWRSLIVWPKQLMIHRWYSSFTWRSLIF